MPLVREKPLSFLDLLPDAGQVGREKAFPAQQFAVGFVAVLSFERDLELLLGRQKPSLLGGTLVARFPPRHECSRAGRR